MRHSRYRVAKAAALAWLFACLDCTTDPNYCDSKSGCFDGDVCIDHRCASPTSGGDPAPDPPPSPGGPEASCDNQGACGDAESGCIACAEKTVCEKPLLDCYDVNDCNQFIGALDACSESAGNVDEECFEAAKELHPEGFALFDKVAQCVFCSACPGDCLEYSMQCP